MYYLAIDIGASSGRHILGSITDGKLQLEEIYRFDNSIKNEKGILVWDTEYLKNQVIAGIAECKRIGKIPKTVAIDTWGVDYVLLDENKKEILPVVSYRDSRTEGIPEEIEKIISSDDLYSRTGIQPMAINTIYQLYCDKKSGKLKYAKHFLMIPDYLSFKLTGVISNEYTNATTTSLVNAVTKNWDETVIGKLGIDQSLFMPLSKPATKIGNFSDEIINKVGFNAEVIHAPSHDTASAVAACPINDNSVYISSGTWSLIGTENHSPILSSQAKNNGFTNEGGVEYRYRFLENIMGTWLFQNIRKNVNKMYSYDEMMIMAEKSNYEKLINPNDSSFLAPDNMIEAIKNYLGDDSLPLADVLKSVYLSLTHSYDSAIKTIEKSTAKTVEKIIIVGGGSKDAYLNKLTSKITGKKVVTGLSEATATGNIISQIMYTEGITLAAARELINKSFSFKEENV